MEKLPAEILTILLKTNLSDESTWRISSPSGTQTSGEPPFPFATIAHADGALATPRKLVLIHVCRAWYRVLVRILYDSVVLRYIGQLPMLVRTLEGPGGADLASFIQSINLTYAMQSSFTRLHVEESSKLLARCPNVSRLAVGGMSLDPWGLGGPIPRVLPQSIASIKSLVHLDLTADCIYYPTLHPILSALSQTLHSLSAPLPAAYTVHTGLRRRIPFTVPRPIIFPLLTDLRLCEQYFLFTTHTLADFWSLPALRNLDIRGAAGTQSMPLLILATIVGGIAKDARRIERLSLPPSESPDFRSRRLVSDHVQSWREILGRCPALRYLRSSISLPPSLNTVTGLPPLFHPRLQVIDVVGGGMVSLVDATQAVEGVLPILKRGMPRLRVCRLVERGLEFLAPTLPALQLLPERQPAEAQLVPIAPEAYRPPAGSYLEFLLCDPAVNSDGYEDAEDDTDYEPPSDWEATGSESDSGTEEEEEEDETQDADSHPDLEDEEMTREDAIALFVSGLHRRGPGHAWGPQAALP
ncbi:hypothetical protein MKEN_00974700 [Mycena kentingensis (nom. inval.)]|nr:hypothetical protein MKEN_00974700 [Mycena kentingensis (nom. inval.)]